MIPRSGFCGPLTGLAVAAVMLAAGCRELTTTEPSITSADALFAVQGIPGKPVCLPYQTCTDTTEGSDSTALEPPADSSPAVATVTVVPDPASLLVGTTAQFEARLYDESGAELIGREVSWMSSDTLVVSVSQSGVASALRTGLVVITATSEGVSGSATVSVLEEPDITTDSPLEDAYQVPAIIVGDCSVDVTAALLAWIKAVPDNSTLSFGQNACYNIDGGLVISDRHGLTFEGNGSTFRVFSKGAAKRSNWRFQSGSNITLRNMIARGANPKGGTSSDAYDTTVEWQYAFAFGGTQGGLLENVQAYDVYGDFVEAEHDLRNETLAKWPGPPARNIIVRDSRFERNGRMGFGLTHVDGFRLERSYVGDVAWNIADLEPSDYGVIIRNVTIVDNTFGPVRYAPLAVYDMFTSTTIENVYFARNKQLGHNAAGCWQPIYLEAKYGYPSNIVVEHNTLYAHGAGVLSKHVRGVVVRNNEFYFKRAGCGSAVEGVGVIATDSQDGAFTDNVLWGGTTAFKGDALSTGWSVSGNIIR